MILPPPSLKEATNNIPHHLLQRKVVFISTVRENIDGWQEPPFFFFFYSADLLVFDAFGSSNGDQII